MLIASLLLIVVAVVLLVLGLADGSSALLVSSIAVSLLAAVALVAGARQVAAARATSERVGPRTGWGFAGRFRPGAPPVGGAGVPPEIPVQHVPTTVGAGGDGWRQPPEPPATGPVDVPWGSLVEAPDDPESVPVRSRSEATAERVEPVSGAPWPDEPEAQQPVSAVDAARIAQLDAEVRVVDGRPRYHLPSCPHLFGRDDEPLPVFEAVSLGFTPCALCAPDTTLLADAPPG
ncbi:hypothetical protein [Micromonospora sp. KC721]|uniref:hypothetical protein n=1 Tax=Micromonospora sp. KC721 TaxID=2530380 RepID=UPI001043613E|nr:hypothetical protein [Micromonospora sp. KC721]TDB82628.1 hypothetical protein E1182_00625 [Micromonospora sp. KC721]